MGSDARTLRRARRDGCGHLLEQVPAQERGRLGCVQGAFTPGRTCTCIPLLSSRACVTAGSWEPEPVDSDVGGSSRIRTPPHLIPLGARGGAEERITQGQACEVSNSGGGLPYFLSKIRWPVPLNTPSPQSWGANRVSSSLRNHSWREFMTNTPRHRNSLYTWIICVIIETFV